MTETNIGERIRSARGKKGWSQYKLAKEAGVQPSTISQIESGARQKPSIDVLQKVAGALSLTVSQLLGQTSEDDFQDLLQNEEVKMFFRNFKDLPEEDKAFIKKQIEILKSQKGS
jgi:transcriptional regulator with XRE-family HTH domain